MTVTQQKHVYLKDLHFEHRLWMNELNFAKDEMVSLNKRLEEVVSKNTDKAFEYVADSLQNRLIRQKDVIGELRHAIKAHESSLAHYAEEHPIAIDHVYFSDHEGLREQMTRFTTLYAQFKAEFMSFIAKWM
jgi:hypothetical protein